MDVFYQDPTFQLASIGAKSPVSTQFIFVTATLPRDIFDMIKVTDYPFFMIVVICLICVYAVLGFTQMYV